jgi:hypothetical protein
MMRGAEMGSWVAIRIGCLEEIEWGMLKGRGEEIVS